MANISPAFSVCSNDSSFPFCEFRGIGSNVRLRDCFGIFASMRDDFLPAPQLRHAQADFPATPLLRRKYDNRAQFDQGIGQKFLT